MFVSQAGMYHDPHGEDGGSSKENRMIFTESMPRRVGSFYRGKEQCVLGLNGLLRCVYLHSIVSQQKNENCNEALRQDIH